MKKKHIVILVCVFIAIIIFAPIVINECYKVNKGYETLWEAKDLLSYMGDVLGAVGTIFIGIIAILQSQQANDISKRLLKIEEINSTPFLHFDISNSVVQSFTNKEVDLLIGLKNETNNVINILEVSDLGLEVFLVNEKVKIPFCKSWTKHYSILPLQTRQINFFAESKKDESPILKTAEYLYSSGFYQLVCKFKIKMEFANFSEVFIQNFEFMIIMASPKNDKNLIKECLIKFDSIENSIEKDIS